jgi:Putative auto-transporter adhesin, head GIN domain
MQKLAIVALIGLTASAACFGAAAAIGGRDFNDDMGFSIFGDRPHCEAVANATATTRDLDWDGSDHIGLSVGGHASYTPGSDNKVHASGDPQLLAHLRIRNGNIELDCNGWHHDHGDLTIILPGQEFKKFGIAGSGNLVLSNLNQNELAVGIAGSGSVKADGKVTEAQVKIAGSGDADLEKVALKVLDVKIAGSGTTDAAPTDQADIKIAGSGDVILHTSPKSLDQHVAGSGRIRILSN